MTIPPFDKARRRSLLETREQLLTRYHLLDEQLQSLHEDDTARRQPVRQEIRKIRDLIGRNRDEYGECLPRIQASICPFTGQPLVIAFDPVDLQGLWWMEFTRRPYEGEQRPPSYRLLKGALNLRQVPPKGGRHDALVGPEVPYVIPRILRAPDMQMVISEIPLQCGYVAYILAYFSSAPRQPGQLSSPWLEKDEYDVADAQGNLRWQAANDAWDFDLESWIKRGRVRWISPGESRLAPQSTQPADCPYLNLPGKRVPQVIQGQQLHERSLPNPDVDVEPFE
ncbi:hypothetical protein WJU23_10905 [Prosthecobacter sp. SYSU 5D2]|uniref:hypothetical protein n=1 Tax=Prosthecobacter sp. SYSU 5D2 TaxID=3134134 RepID=UPI0031FEBF13